MACKFYIVDDFEIWVPKHANWILGTLQSQAFLNFFLFESPYLLMNTYYPYHKQKLCMRFDVNNIFIFNFILFSISKNHN